MRLPRSLPLGALLITLAGCELRDVLRDRMRAATPHERYAAGLEMTGLDQSALGRTWLRAADSVLARPLRIVPPYREAGYFPATEANAVAFRIDVRHGQHLSIDVLPIGDADAPAPVLFVDLFERIEGGPPRRLTSGDSTGARIRRNIDRDGWLLLRLQPELLRTMRFTLTVQTSATLAFPLKGKDSRAVLSFWGASRDAGARRHEGIDIFAPRGTPAIAAAAGVVSAVQVTPLGGRVVWVWDTEHQQSLYYAHLDTQLVARGDRVAVGDVVGLVGNSGNAQSTPSHLHFGVYRRGSGAVDPFPFVDDLPRPIATITADVGSLGQWRRVSARSVVALDGLGTGATRLDPGALLRAEAAQGGRYRVRTADGLAGWAAASALEDGRRPMATLRLTSGATLRLRPATGALSLGELATGSSIELLGRAGSYARARSGGREGWIEQTALRSAASASYQ
ncbi:MAG: M23 family metallopeptidase [Gemmatimonadaceae bacterium]